MDWADPPVEITALKGSDKHYLRLPRDALVSHASGLLEADGSERRHRDGGQSIVMEIRIEALLYYREALERIAKGDLTPLGECL